MGPGEGREASGQDHVPARLLHLPRRARDRVGSGRVFDRQSPQVDPADRLAAFSPLIRSIRWGTVVVGFVIAALRGPIGGAVGAWGTALVVYAAIRTFFPLRYYEDQPVSLLLLLGELALTVIAMAATVVALFMGLFSMARGGDFDKRNANRFMRLLYHALIF